MQTIPFPTGLKTAPKLKVKITQRALFARLSRSFAKENKSLKKCRQDGHGYDYLGDYYVVDTYQNAVIDRCVNLEAYARDRKVMAEWEELEDGQGA
jgi:hypothetical protein